MKKIVYSIIITIYAIIAVFTTICLLSYNDYKITEFGNYSLVIIPDNELNENLSQGDLVIVDKKGKVNNGDYVFFYNTYSKSMDVTVGEVTNVEQVTTSETTYTLAGDTKISSAYVMGPVNGSVKIPVVGTILGVIESQWGFLFLIVFPSLIAFIYEITVVVGEIKESKKTAKKE